MTAAWFFSDLHQEFADNAWDPARHAPASFDMVVAAGDVHVPLTSSIDWLADRFPGLNLLYVPGNHDFWSPSLGHGRFTLPDMLERGREHANRRGIRLLSDDVAVIGGTRWVGATTWTDFALGSTSLAHGIATARRGMRDYHRIRRRTTGRHHFIRCSEILDLHRRSRRHIEETLSIPFDGPSIVVTHHAPAAASLPDRWFDLGWCYASDLTSTIALGRPDAWLHGHLHHPVDYQVGGTRVLSNPRGHVEEGAAFDPGLVIEIGTHGVVVPARRPEIARRRAA